MKTVRSREKKLTKLLMGNRRMPAAKARDTVRRYLHNVGRAPERPIWAKREAEVLNGKADS